MKKVIVSLFLFIAICMGIFLGFSVHNKKTTTSNAEQTLEAVTSYQPTHSPTPSIGIPQTFSIPSLHVTTHIEQVAMDSLGRMDVPKNVFDVAWYDLGPRPGEKGSAVIDGHYDTQTGAPAVFYSISQLRPGDTIIITDDNGQNYTFIITLNKNYPYNQLPLQKIFATNDKPRLNLITCSGVWDRQQHNYSTRDVIYAEEE